MSELTSCVVICTRNRAADLDRCIRSIVDERATCDIVVIDASSREETRLVCERWAGGRANVHYHRADRAGLARQRNQSVPYCRSLGVDVVHFLDDDSEILPGYFDAIESRFAAEEAVAGVGGIVENMADEFFTRFKRFFFLWGRKPGRVLRSGRVVKGQHPDGAAAYEVDFLLGCSMSYRLAVLERNRFEDRLQGRSLGEDARFGFQVSRTARLMVEPTARCLHHESDLNRQGTEELSFERTILIYSWVTEQRSHGMSPLLFVWSAIGDTLMRVIYAGVKRDGRELGQAKGDVKALWRIARGNVTVEAAYPQKE
ncbi:MAG: glycosyltransferase family A protein [Acidimicrobiales bacterium]